MSDNLLADRKDISPAMLLGLLIVLCLACDFLMVPVLSMGPGRPTIPVFPFLLAIVGSVLAQGCLLAAWLAWSDRPFWERFTRHWVVAAILYLVWSAGVAVGQRVHFAEVNSSVGPLVPLMSIAAQMPLWMAKQLFGWRLVRGEKTNDAGPMRLSIRDLMTATVLVALALAVARLARSPDGKGMEFVWIVMFLVAATVSTITLLPASALLLRMGPFERGTLFACLYAAFWIGVPWIVVLIAWHRGLFPPPPLVVLLGLSCSVVSFAATVILAAAAARARGYRLVWGRAPAAA